MTDASHILVVDDNQAAADALVRLMKALGTSAVAVYGPHEAIEHAREGDVRLAFVDIGMPDMDGHSLMRILRNEGYEGPAFALSGYGGEDDRERAAEAGFTGHLTKPASVKDIKDVLDAYVLS